MGTPVILSSDFEPTCCIDLDDFLDMNADGISEEEAGEVRMTIARGDIYRGGGGASMCWSVGPAPRPRMKRRDGAVLDEIAGGYSDIGLASLPVGALPSDGLTYLVPDDRRWDLAAWRRAYSRDAAALTGNPDGEAW